MNSFYELDETRQLDLIAELAAAALERWNLSGARLELLKHRENSVFAVYGKDGSRQVMRVHRENYRSNAELCSELQWLDALQDAGVKTTEALRCVDGAHLATVATAALPEGRQCDMLSWVNGAALGSIETGVALEAAALQTVYKVLGEQTARIHHHGINWKRPPGFSRQAWDEEGFVGDKAICGHYWKLDVLTGEQRDLMLRAGELVKLTLQSFGKSDDRYGLVHGDLLPENLFLHGDELRLIDWDDCGFGWHLYDFATAMFLHMGQPSFDIALPAMLEGYRGIRPLPDEHLELLPVLVLARALAYVGWTHSRRETSTAREMAPLIVFATCELAEQLLSGR